MMSVSALFRSIDQHQLRLRRFPLSYAETWSASEMSELP
jgi:hypothetical protein